MNDANLTIYVSQVTRLAYEVIDLWAWAGCRDQMNHDANREKMVTALFKSSPLHRGALPQQNGVFLSSLGIHTVFGLIVIPCASDPEAYAETIQLLKKSHGLDEIGTIRGRYGETEALYAVRQTSSGLPFVTSPPSSTHDDFPHELVMASLNDLSPFTHTDKHPDWTTYRPDASDHHDVSRSVGKCQLTQSHSKAMQRFQQTRGSESLRAMLEPQTVSAAPAIVPLI